MLQTACSLQSGAGGRAFRSPDPDRLRGVFQRLSETSKAGRPRLAITQDEDVARPSIAGPHRDRARILALSHCRHLHKLGKKRGGDRRSTRQAVGLVSEYRQAIQDAELEERAAERYQQVALVRARDFERYLRERKERASSFAARPARMTIHPAAAPRKQVKSARFRAGCSC